MNSKTVLAIVLMFCFAPAGCGYLQLWAEELGVLVSNGVPDGQPSFETIVDIGPIEVLLSHREFATDYSRSSSTENQIFRPAAEGSRRSNADDERHVPKPDAIVGEANSNIANDVRDEKDAATSQAAVDLGNNPPPRTFSPDMVALRNKLRRVLGFYYQKPVHAKRDSSWSVMHWCLAFGVDAQVRSFDSQPRNVNALGWLAWNRRCAGNRLMSCGPDKNLSLKLGPGFQGHEGQLLAVFAQCRVKPSYEMRVSGQRLTVDDLIQHEMKTCQRGTELTFKLIGLSHYLSPDTSWEDYKGHRWDIAKMIKLELAEPIHSVACGGTHRMMGLSYAVYKREQHGLPITGQWHRARVFVNDYVRYTFGLQNRDGSFSSNWFRGRGEWGGIDRKIQTTGHILEWLVFSLPDEELTDPRVLKSVHFLANTLIANRHHDWEIGPKAHALRVLSNVESRLFQPQRRGRQDRLAQRPASIARQ